MENEYIEILLEENKVLSEVLENQALLRKTVNNKDWSNLLDVISRINLLMDSFNILDEKREKIASGKKNDSEEEKKLLSEAKSKLLRLRSENKALSEYIDITRGFVRKTIDEALPQSKNKLYTKKGYSVHQPESVVVNTLF